jgi:D-serine deaminase-like pyridoxal phosphate-dependent protein
MSERVRSAGVNLRPHGKTHKVPEIGWMQVRAGAVGISLAKTSEAEVFAKHGFPDLFIAYPVVSPTKATRLVALSRRTKLTVGIDSFEGASMLGEAAAREGAVVRVSLKVDCGYHRVGVAPEVAVEIGQRIASIKGLALVGVFTHAGQAYGRSTAKEIEADAAQESRTVAEAAAGLRKAGVPIEVVSVGSTPTSRFGFNQGGITEARPGNYVYLDRTQLALGTCAEEDIAMSVLATVVSIPAKDRVVLDSGSKTLASDQRRPTPDGFGQILGTETRLVSLSEEHGVGEIAPGESFRIGQRVRVIQNHACVVSNLHDRIHGVRGERVETEFEVAARGCVD